jgi:hypothetical protein
LILGVGLGWGRPEFETFGEDGNPRVRAEKLDEGLEVLNGLWSGRHFSYTGKHYQIENACFVPQPVQSPRIPIWVCGAWPKKAPFQRAARWDGIVAICGTGENRAILPDEIRAANTYIKQQRDGTDPFDTIVILWSEGDHSVQEQEETVRYAEAGTTWWLEDLSFDRFASLKDTRERLYKGPPGLQTKGRSER